MKRRGKTDAAGTAAPKPARAKRKLRVPLAAKITGGVLVVLFAALCAFIYLYPYAFPGVTVGSIPVGGIKSSQHFVLRAFWFTRVSRNRKERAVNLLHGR